MAATAIVFFFVTLCVIYILIVLLL